MSRVRVYLAMSLDGYVAGADNDLSEFMRLLTVTHTQGGHTAHGTAGTGPLYQGRFKSFPIQGNNHFLTVC